MPFISVRVSLALSTVIFVFLIIVIAIIFGLLATSALENSAHEVGRGEISTANEVFNSRITNVVHRMDAVSTAAQVSPLWAQDPVKYNSSTVQGVVAWFNATLLAEWTSDVYENLGWVQGYGFQTVIPKTANSALYDLSIPQIYYDLHGDGTRGYNLGYMVDTTGTPDIISDVELFRFKMANTTVTTEVGVQRETTAVLEMQSLVVQEPVYSFQTNSTDYARRRTNAGNTGWWDDILLWVGIDGFAYHYFTYASVTGVLPGNNNQSQCNGIGWIAVADIFQDSKVQTVGTVLLIDSKARILATNKPVLNAALQQLIARPDFSSENIVDVLQPGELGTNFPDPTVRAVFDVIYPTLASLSVGARYEKLLRSEATGDRYFVHARVIHEEMGLHMVWFSGRDVMMDDVERNQIVVGIVIVALSVMIAALVLFASYKSVVGPLRYLSLSLKALSDLNMVEVERLQENCLNPEEFSVKEISSLFTSYESVKGTMTTCLPYIPQIDGDLRLGQMEQDIVDETSILDEDLTPISSGGSTPLQESSDRSAMSMSESSDRVSRVLSSDGGSSPGSSKHQPHHQKAAELFNVLDRSSNSRGGMGLGGGVGHSVASMADGLAHRNKNPFTPPVQNRNKNKPAVKPAFDSSGSSGNGRSLTSILGVSSSATTSSSSVVDMELERVHSGSFTATTTTTNKNAVWSGVNSELVLRDRAVVAHFRLRSDVQYDATPGSIQAKAFKEATFLLQYYATKVASEHKGSVFRFGTSEVYCVWANVAQSGKKAVEAAVQAVEVIINKCVPILAQHKDLSIPILTVGVTQGPCLLGTTGTLLKRTYVCEGPAVKRAAILSDVGHQIRAHILTDSAVRDGASMFAELRPVEEVKIPAFRTSVLSHKACVMTVWECIGLRGSAKISSKLGSDLGAVSGTAPSQSSKKNDQQVEGADGGGAMEWMYQLQAQEKEEASRLALATEAHGALKAVNLEAYRQALQKWINECFNPHDLYLVQRYHVFCEKEGNNDIQQFVDDSSPLMSTSGNAPHSALIGNSPTLLPLAMPNRSQPQVISSDVLVVSTTIGPEELVANGGVTNKQVPLATVPSPVHGGASRSRSPRSLEASMGFQKGRGASTGYTAVTAYFERLNLRCQPYYRDSSIVCAMPFPYESAIESFGE